MTQLAFTLSEIKSLKPCKDSMSRIISLLGEDWETMPIDAKMASEKGVTLNDLIWVVHKLSRKDAEIALRLRMFAADCAAHILHIYEFEFRYGENYPRKAILAIRSGNLDEIEKSRDDAWASSIRSGDSAFAAASAVAASIDAIAAARLAVDAVVSFNKDKERKWQTERFIQWFSDNPPEPYEI